MAITKVDPALLNVTNDQDFSQIRGQAMDIAGWACAMNTNVVVMQHNATEEQIADIEALSAAENKPVALIGGQFTLMLHVRGQLLAQGFLVVEAKTARVSEEITEPDGSVRKVSVFKYEGLRILED